MRRLLVNFGRVGDVVLLVPMLRALAAAGEIELLTRPWAKDLLGDQPWLTAIHALAKPGRGLRFPASLWGSAERTAMENVLDSRGYDEVLAFSAEKPAILAWLRRRFGKRLREIGIPWPGEPTHLVEINRRILVATGFDPAPGGPYPRLDVPQAEVAAAAARLAPLGARVLALQAGSSLTSTWFRKRPNLKGLTASQWATLVARILADGEADAAVLIGTAPEGREARAIIAALPEGFAARVHDWTGQVPLRRLPGLFRACHALLSVDTGPAHIAAAVGAPLLSVFGPTNPAKWLPRSDGPVELLLGSAPCQFCEDTRVFKRCRANICLTTLHDDAVHAVWSRLNARLAPRQPVA
jgi:ADP-heptose:LPS heptosyltransferase